MNLSEQAKQTLHSKMANIKRNKFIYAPLPEEIDDWDIMEARGHGVPQAVFFDTRNKITIFPSDIPEFSTHFTTEMFAWCDGNGWKDTVSQISVLESQAILKELKQYFNSQCIPAYLLYIRGSCKGYVSVLIDDDDDEYSTCCLWVYTSDNLFDKLFNN